MRTLLLILAVVTLAGAWERQGARYLYRGWSVPLPDGFTAKVDDDALDLTSADGKLRLILVPFESQKETEEALTDIFADMKKQNGGKLPVAHRFPGRAGLQFIRRTVAISDRQLNVVHVLKPGAHLMALYHVKRGAVPDVLENVLLQIECD